MDKVSGGHLEHFSHVRVWGFRLHGWHLNLSHFSVQKLDSFSLVFLNNFLKYLKLSYMSIVSRDTSISCASTARDLGVIFNSNMFVFDQICAVSESCFSHNRHTRRIGYV